MQLKSKEYDHFIHSKKVRAEMKGEIESGEHPSTTAWCKQVAD